MIRPPPLNDSKRQINLSQFVDFSIGHTTALYKGFHQKKKLSNTKGYFESISDITATFDDSEPAPGRLGHAINCAVFLDSMVCLSSLKLPIESEKNNIS